MSKEKRNDVCTENEEYMIETITNKFKRSTRVAFLSTLIWGVLAHGMALFNKFSCVPNIVYVLIASYNVIIFAAF